jgi:hypothetical protein
MTEKMFLFYSEFLRAGARERVPGAQCMSGWVDCTGGNRVTFVQLREGGKDRAAVSASAGSRSQERNVSAGHQIKKNKNKIQEICNERHGTLLLLLL